MRYPTKNVHIEYSQRDRAMLVLHMHTMLTIKMAENAKHLDILSAVPILFPGRFSLSLIFIFLFALQQNFYIPFH